MSDIYDALLKDYTVMNGGEVSTSHARHGKKYYVPKKSQPGYEHGNKKSLKGNKNKLQIPEEFIAKIVKACDRKGISVSAAWRESGTKFTLAAIARRVKLYRQKNNIL